MSEILPDSPGGPPRRPSRRRQELPQVSRLPAPVFLTAGDGTLLDWNRAFAELIELTPTIQVPHLVRQQLLAGGLATLEELARAADSGRALRIRMRSLGGRQLDLVATSGSHPSRGRGRAGGRERTLTVVLADGAEWNRSEGRVRREVHRLEALLEESGRGSDLEESRWREAAAALLELLPGPAVLLDRDLKPLLPRLEEEGPPVLCHLQLFGNPGLCPTCLAARAQASGRQESQETEAGTLIARPLPGGMVVEWMQPR